jgi:hypothetical protein
VNSSIFLKHRSCNPLEVLNLIRSHACCIFARLRLRLTEMPAAMSTEKATSIEPNGSNASNSPASSDSGSKKRGPSQAGLENGQNPKPAKRRAAKACAACRARKVRCDVMQRYHVTADGEVTCSNCTMDGIKCVIEESKRRK